MKKRPYFTPVLLLGLLLSSCISVSGRDTTPTAPVFITATLPPTHPAASTRTPTAAASPIPSSAATGPAGCKYQAVLLQDVTIPDGTNVPRGTKFTKTWQFKNTGTCAWTGYAIAFVSGDRMGSPDSAPVPATTAGESVNVSVELVAPSSDGAYTGYFELRDSAGTPLQIGIEKTFWVKITVGTVIPGSAAPLGTPSGGTPVTKPKGPASCTYLSSSSYPNEIATLINSARSQAGLPALTLNAQLAAAAQGHSIDMACFSLLSHTGSDGSSIYERIVAAGYVPSYSLEIIYAGGYPQDAFNWWMNDQIHHDAILSWNVTEMGVGYAYVSDSAYGGYFTVDFGSR
jgi:uncharacterized protein YkwD